MQKPEKRKAGQPVEPWRRRKIVSMLKKGAAAARVARECEVTEQTVRRIRHDGGIPPRKSGVNEISHVTPEQDQQIDRLLKQTNRPGDQAIADKVGVSKGSVSRRRRALGIAPYPSGGNSHVLDASDDTRSRLKSDEEVSRLRGELKKALEHLTELEDLRAGIFGLKEPRRPTITLRRNGFAKGARSAILHLSDIHYAETIDLAEMDGLNSYNVSIADNRLARTFDTVCRLLTEFWQGTPVETLHVCLGGDLVSGGIHPELSRTDALNRLPQARAVATRIADGIAEVRKRVGCRVKVYSVPGNHGRLTMKPEHKNHVEDNLDTLAAWFMEARLSADKGVEFFYGVSVDVVFEVYGRAFLVSHGDRMGSKGGQGFIGPVATILRGHFKLRADYATRGIFLYKILTAHFHTTCELPTGYGNGCLGGWSDFARDLRAEKEQASQNLLIIHEERGVIDSRRIMPGIPAEGSMYERG